MHLLISSSATPICFVALTKQPFYLMNCKYLKVGTGAAGLNMKRLFKSGTELLLLALAHTHFDPHAHWIHTHKVPGDIASGSNA